MWFDWADATIANPLLDLLVTDRMGDDTLARWDRAWREASPGCDPTRARSLLGPMAGLLGAWIYQHFLDNIEPTERIYHRDDMTRMLDRAERLVVTGR